MIVRRRAEATEDRRCQPPAANRYFIVSLVTLALSGCATHPPPAVPDQFISLNRHSLRLHLENADAVTTRPLLVYATGDGGMHRKDLDTFRHLISFGNPIVGFDARDY